MNTISDLPGDVIKRILGYCPQYIVYQLLKSKTVAAIAYSVLFKNVKIESPDAPYPIAQITDNYVDTTKPDPFQCCDFKLVPDPVEGVWSFTSARELVSFYRTHPLFVPDTLTYAVNSDLKEIEKLKPGLLKKFKWFSYSQAVYDKIVFDVSELKHKSFVFSNTLTPDQLPKHIETLGYNGTAVDEEFSSKVPNIRHLRVYEGGIRQVSTISLETLSMNTSGVDLSKLINLKRAAFSLRSDDAVVGYSADCQVRLPLNLQVLELENVKDGSQVSLEEGKALTQLSISFLGSADSTKAKLPPNVNRLNIKVWGLDALKNTPEIPKSAEILTLERFGNLDMVLSPNITHLSLIDCRSSEPLDVKSLSHLVSLRVDNSINGYPPQIENLSSGWYTKNEGHNMDDVKSLKYADIKYMTLFDELNLVIPSPMKTMTLRRPELRSVSGGDNLITLKLLDLQCSTPVSLVKLKSLKKLTIGTDGQVPLPELPPSLESLELNDVYIPNGFKCPKNLKLLELYRCSFPKKSTFSLNEGLEVLWLNYTTLEADSLFKTVGKHLKTIHMQSSILGTLTADFSGTNLQSFTMAHNEYKGKKVKFPRSLRVFKILDMHNDVMKWADCSLCDQLWEASFPAVVFYNDTSGRKKFDKFQAELSTKMDDFTVKKSKSTVPERVQESKKVEVIVKKTETLSLEKEKEKEKEPSKWSRKVKLWKR